jgi:hypothetical protein
MAKKFPIHSLTTRSVCCSLATFIVSVFCLNVAVLSLIGSYDIRLGAMHLMAHGLFKPILMMNGCFVLALMVCGSLRRKDSSRDPDGVLDLSHSSTRFCALSGILISLTVLAVYVCTVQINFSHHDWTHRHISAGINSLHSIWELFTSRQADGFYRPLTFVSLWVDYRLFGSWYPGYHIQSIALHVINSLLAAWLAGTLGSRRTSALWTGLFYAVAAVNFEPVLWPAARFDLLATAFTLTALILAVRHFCLPASWTWELPASQLCFAVGILNKESSYCLPLLILFILCTHSVWSIPRPTGQKALVYFSLMTAIATTMIFVRIAVYGSLGGYPHSVARESDHFVLGQKTITSLLRVLPLSIFGVNTTSAAPGWLPALLIVVALFVLTAAVASRGCFGRREYSLVACTFLASIPVLNIVGWIGSPMQHSRYLYMPAVFSMLLMASVLRKVRRAGFFLGIYFLVNATGVLANVSCYRNMLARCESIAESVRSDWMGQPGTKAVYLVNIPEHPDGVFYFGSELVERIERKIPNAAIVRLEMLDSIDPKGLPTLVYQWSNADRTLVSIPR